MQHPEVPHPTALRLRQDLTRYERGFRGKVSQANDFLASHLGLFFGSVWVVWVFFIWPLISPYFGTVVQGKTSYYAQSWIQLFALPLFVYIGNKLQRTSDAQSDAMTQALTHIATVEDQNNQLIQVMHQLLTENTELTRAVHAALDNPGNKS